MVDSIAGKNHIQDAGLLSGSQQAAGSQSVEKVNTDSARNSASVSPQFLDEAMISEKARQAYEAEKETLRFSRLAQRVKSPVDNEKVTQIKALVDSGRINEYLRSINTDELANSILNSPSGAFLR